MGADNHLLILGCGYSGRALARRMTQAGWRVTGVTRSVERAKQIETDGATGLAADPVHAEGRSAILEALQGATHLLASAPPQDTGDPYLSAMGAQIASSPKLSWAGYFSTTGVYGDRSGGWAFEWDTPTPQNTRSKRRLAAETAWRAACGAKVFRIAGIYGPGRSALDRVRAGEARIIDKPGQVFARIHVDDIAGCVAASIARPKAEGPFNLSDDRPCSSGEVTRGACALLGVDPPAPEPWDPSTVSPMMASFYSESRRTANARTKARLAWRPAYPTWREGLRAILDAEA
jgi:nucleoside-diphosphate-sugar epimerase